MSRSFTAFDSGGRRGVAEVLGLGLLPGVVVVVAALRVVFLSGACPLSCVAGLVLFEMTSKLGPNDNLAVSRVFRLVLCLPEVSHVRTSFVAAFLVCLQADLGACPLVYMVPDWSGWFALCVAVCFKQAQGACTLDVSLRLVCSRLQLIRGSFKSTSFCC